MRLTRLFILVSFVSCAGLLLAQSQPSDTTRVASNTKVSIVSSDNGGADQFRLVPYPDFGLNLEGVNLDENHAPAGVDAAQNGDHSGQDLRQERIPMPSAAKEIACFSIRSYVVVRDSPNSDATHSDGYTTCVPSARFRVYSAVAHGR